MFVYPNGYYRQPSYNHLQEELLRREEEERRREMIRLARAREMQRRMAEEEAWRHAQAEAEWRRRVAAQQEEERRKQMGWYDSYAVPRYSPFAQLFNEPPRSAMPAGECRQRSRSPRQREQSPAAAPAPTPEPERSEPEPSTPTLTQEDLDAAASKIQTFYRTRRSLRSICSLRNSFQTLKSSFIFPSALDFIGADGAIIPLSTSPSSPNTIPADQPTKAALAYTPTNVSLHSYVESLNKLLISLDGIESYGDKAVREMRKAVVRLVETEIESVEERWRSIWRDASRVEHAAPVPQLEEQIPETMKNDEEAIETSIPVEEVAASTDKPEEDSATPMEIEPNPESSPTEAEIEPSLATSVSPVPAVDDLVAASEEVHHQPETSDSVDDDIFLDAETMEEAVSAPVPATTAPTEPHSCADASTTIPQSLPTAVIDETTPTLPSESPDPISSTSTSHSTTTSPASEAESLPFPITIQPPTRDDDASQSDDEEEYEVVDMITDPSPHPITSSSHTPGSPESEAREEPANDEEIELGEWLWDPFSFLSSSRRY